MKNIARFVFLLIVICNLCPMSFADGRFYSKENIPEKNPYQRAFLIFHEGYETLILQSTCEFLQKDVSIGRIGWVVPVPSTPEILSFDPENADRFFLNVARSTQPKIIDISTIIFVVFLLLCNLFSVIYIGFFIIIFLFYPTQKWQSGKKYYLKYLPFFFISLFVYFVLYIPCRSRAISSPVVDFVKSEPVGIYDVQVIKSDSENAIVEWLNENGFKYSDNDINVFKEYIEKKWCFVVAKVQPYTGSSRKRYRKMTAPLVLKFKSDKAAYPLALKSLDGQKTEVVIYTLTENKQTCGGLIPLKRSMNIGTLNMKNNFQKTGDELKRIYADLPSRMNICKFKELPKPEQMNSDLIFEPAADNKPYIETKIIW